MEYSSNLQSSSLYREMGRASEGAEAVAAGANPVRPPPAAGHRAAGWPVGGVQRTTAWRPPGRTNTDRYLCATVGFKRT